MARQDGGLPPFLFDQCMDNEQFNAGKTVCLVNQAYTHVLVIFLTIKIFIIEQMTHDLINAVYCGVKINMLR